MKGRPTDPSQIKLSQTRSRDPQAAEARRVAKELAEAAGGGRAYTDGKGGPLVGSRRTDSPFLGAVRKLKSLTPAEIKIVEAAQNKGFGLNDAAAFWMYQFLKLESAVSAKEIDGKAYAVGLNQLLTAATKLAEVSARLTVGNTPSDIQIVFDLAKTLTGSNDTQAAPDPDFGDDILVG